MNFKHTFLIFPLVGLLGGSGLWAQAPYGSVPVPQSRFPQIPQVAPRQMEGTGEGQQFGSPKREPLGGFLDGLPPNDAAVTMILGQSRLLTLKKPISTEKGDPVIGIGDPTVADAQVLPNGRMIRISSLRAGVTDLTITTDSGQTYSFEVLVTYDLDLLTAQIRQLFPNTSVRLGQIREHLIVEGEARSPQQVTAIIQTLQAYLTSMQVDRSTSGSSELPEEEEDNRGQRPSGQTQPSRDSPDNQSPPTDSNPRVQPPSGNSDVQAQFAAAQIINLLRVPGVQQVMLQVKIAELNRTGLREIGTDLFMQWGGGNTLGTQIAGNPASLLGLGLGNATTGFGLFPSGRLETFLRALRRNSVLTILAEPNLVAMHAQEASFLAGGEFPVPVPQATGGGGASVVTIQFKKFGVQLNFTPYIEDNDVIRLRVNPETSTIDDAIGTEINGTVVPGISTRRVSTTVELKQGQTLALAGLLNVELDAQTSRIPGLGDLPYIGRMFSNTSNRRVERELLVLVTPYMVSPMSSDQQVRLPGQEILEPNDLEFYLLGRLEGRTGRPFRSTTHWDDPFHLTQRLRLESKGASGPLGFSPAFPNSGKAAPVVQPPHYGAVRMAPPHSFVPPVRTSMPAHQPQAIPAPMSRLPAY